MRKRPRKAARLSSTVLVVDHDHTLRTNTRRLLESIGYRVLDAGDVAGAEQIARLYVGPIHILLVEVGISGMSWSELTDRLRSLKPELRVLFVSGRARTELVKQGRLGARVPFIRKPFKKAQLAVKVRGVLGNSR